MGTRICLIYECENGIGFTGTGIPKDGNGKNK